MTAPIFEYNIFRKILKELPYPNNKIIADNTEEQPIADQLAALLNHKIKEDRDSPYS